MTEKQLLSNICKGLSNLQSSVEGISVDTSALESLVQELIDALNDKVDFEYKAIGAPICYECLNGSKYQQVICNKYEDGVLVSTESIIVGSDGVLEALPECAVLCSEIVETYEVIPIDVCFDDCTTGYNLIKINTATNEVTTIGTFNTDSTPSTKTIAECDEIQIVEQTLCENT